jgi:hypothetical protein
LWAACGSKVGRRKQKYFAKYERIFFIMEGVIWRNIIVSENL